MSAEKLWTLKDLAEKAEPKRSISTWRRIIREGKLAAIRIGSGRGILYVKTSELERLNEHGQT
jgi:hypothetical protein